MSRAVGAAPEGGARLPLLAAFTATSVANYAFSLLMARLLMPSGFGVLAFAQTLLLISGLVLESGVPWSLARTLSRGDAPVVAATRHATLLNLSVSALLAATCLALFAAGPLRSGLDRWSSALLLSAALPFMALVGVARGVAQGRGRLRALAAVTAAEVLGKALCGSALVLLGLGVGGAVAGFAAGALLATLLGGALLHREHGEQRWLTRPAQPVRLGVGPMFQALLAGALLLNLDLLLLKVLPGGGARAAGEYQAALVLANAPYFLAASVLVPPLFASLSRADLGLLAGSGRPLSTSAPPDLPRALGLALLLVLPLNYLLALAPSTWLGLLFPAGYAQAAFPLSVRALGSALATVVALLSAALQAFGLARRAAVALFILSAAETASLLLLVPRLGAAGAAWSFLGSAAAAALWLGLLIRQLGVALLPVPWAARYGLAVLLGAGTAGLARLLGLPQLTGAAVFVLAFGSAAWALGLRHIISGAGTPLPLTGPRTQPEELQQ